MTTDSTEIDGNRQIAARALVGVLRSAATRPRELRHHVVRDLWSVAKRFGSQQIANVEIREIPGVRDTIVSGYVDDPNRGVLAALCATLEARAFFEIGTNRGRTALTVARSNPAMTVYTLDLPSPDASIALDINDSDRDFLGDEWASGEAFQATPEAARIQVLHGDSATFDYTPYAGRMDVVFIDGAHSYSYVRNDTEAALRMLAPRGAIVWDDYPGIPGVYRYLNELAPTLDGKLFHIFGTRLVVHTSRELVRRLTAREYARLGAA